MAIIIDDMGLILHQVKYEWVTNDDGTMTKVKILIYDTGRTEREDIVTCTRKEYFKHLLKEGAV